MIRLRLLALLLLALVLAAVPCQDEGRSYDAL